MGKVEERLWSIIRNFAVLGRDHPAMLVNAVRIIELQELVDRSLEASAGGAMRLPLGQRRQQGFCRGACCPADSCLRHADPCQLCPAFPRMAEYSGSCHIRELCDNALCLAARSVSCMIP